MKKTFMLTLLLNILSITSLNSQNMPDISMMDGDGNVYKASWFGIDNKNGAYWTVANLWSTRDGNGQPFTDESLLLNSGIKDSEPIAINGKLSTNKADNISYFEGKEEAIKWTTLSQKDYAQKYGLMYSWYQATQACPKGWHLPSKEDWAKLSEALGGTEKAGTMMRGNSGIYYKSDDKIYQWGKETLLQVNTFNGLPAGHIGSKGKTQALGVVSVWWADAYGLIYGQSYNADKLYINEFAYHSACSIRCVKD